MPPVMKLVHITSSLKVGGAETLLCDLLNGLSGKLFEHHVIFFHDGPIRARIESRGIKTYQVSGLVCMYDPFFWVRLWRCIRTIKPDGIHTLLWAATIAGRLVGATRGIPVVSVYHNNVDQNGAIRNSIDRFTAQLSTKIIAVSDEVADSISAHNMTIARRNVMVIRNGINCEKIESLAAHYQVKREDYGLSSEHFIIGSVGRWVSVKNYPLLLRAFALVQQHMKHARLFLVGQGPEEHTLRTLARQLGIYPSVYFVKANPAYGYYRLFDVFVQSSDKEGISMALLEAMCLQVPCVVTNRNLTHSVISHDLNGLVVPAGDVVRLSDVLLKISPDRKLRDRLADVAYTVLRRDFSDTHMLSQYQQIFWKMGNNSSGNVFN
ncbi:glycosyltransferase [Candidatus Dependentiae bacterium]|nr:glycosyltransferase [Candidatus Dependentiae bacterium]